MSSRSMKRKRTVYIDDIPVVVHYYIHPAEPDVGIFSEYVEVDEVDLSVVEAYVINQFETEDIYEEEY